MHQRSPRFVRTRAPVRTDEVIRPAYQRPPRWPQGSPRVKAGKRVGGSAYTRRRERTAAAAARGDAADRPDGYPDRARVRPANREHSGARGRRRLHVGRRHGRRGRGGGRGPPRGRDLRGRLARGRVGRGLRPSGAGPRGLDRPATHPGPPFAVGRAPAPAWSLGRRAADRVHTVWAARTPPPTTPESQRPGSEQNRDREASLKGLPATHRLAQRCVSHLGASNILRRIYFNPSSSKRRRWDRRFPSSDTLRPVTRGGGTGSDVGLGSCLGARVPP